MHHCSIYRLSIYDTNSNSPAGAAWVRTHAFDSAPGRESVDRSPFHPVVARPALETGRRKRAVFGSAPLCARCISQPDGVLWMQNRTVLGCVTRGRAARVMRLYRVQSGSARWRRGAWAEAAGARLRCGTSSVAEQKRSVFESTIERMSAKSPFIVTRKSNGQIDYKP